MCLHGSSSSLELGPQKKTEKGRPREWQQRNNSKAQRNKSGPHRRMGLPINAAGLQTNPPPARARPFPRAGPWLRNRPASCPRHAHEPPPHAGASTAAGKVHYKGGVWGWHADCRRQSHHSCCKACCPATITPARQGATNAGWRASDLGAHADSTQATDKAPRIRQAGRWSVMAAPAPAAAAAAGLSRASRVRGKAGLGERDIKE